ncbi:MAG: polysaccharide deacetylase family protein [Bifidobacteriaceae bacterium]|jgi:peptidoglycan/xylan/chitin deacetylase (PgdA/CDA1 family)|nr:polysaccharide deacetylase family protein [Bifidobacteriaceae bacterium]
MLPAKGTVAQATPRETVSFTPPPQVAKAEPPTPSPEPPPPPPPPAGGVDCAVVACVALTFDDGPSAYSTALLDKLAELGVKATFFNTGQNSANRPDSVKRQVEDGHLVGGHSWNHTDMKKVSIEQACADADRTARAIRDASGFESPFVRPPYGSWSDAILRGCTGKIFVLWDVDTMDWSSHDGAKILEHAVNDPKPGSIILMHDTVAETIDALPGIVAGLRAKGFQLVTVAGLFNSPIAPDQAIYSGPRTGALTP